LHTPSSPNPLRHVDADEVAIQRQIADFQVHKRLEGAE